MKKVSIALVLISFLAVLVVPMVVGAVEPQGELIGQCKMRNDLTGTKWTDAGITCAAKTQQCKFTDPDKDCAACCVLDTVYSVTNWIFVIVLALVVIFVLIGAVQILTAGGSPEKVNTGRNYIIYAIVGATVAALAKAIPAIVRSFLGIS